jgi:hypothetical protein
MKILNQQLKRLTKIILSLFKVNCYTETTKPTITPISKQEIDYPPDFVLAIPKDPQAKLFTLVQALLS